MADQLGEQVSSATAALSGPRYKLLDATGKVPEGAGLYAIHGGPESWLQLEIGRAHV